MTQSTSDIQPDRGSIRAVTVYLLLLVMFLGLAVRFYDLDDLPLDFNATRQLHSATIARGMFYENKSDVPDWQRQMAVTQWKNQGLIEPQINERLSAFAYSLLGEEALWVPRVLSIVFWTAAAFALHDLLRRGFSALAAAVGLAFFYLLPFGVMASRAFMPDPLMITGILLAWLMFYRYQRTSSTRGAVLAGISAGLAIYIKTTAVFFILFPFAFALLASAPLTALLRDKRVWLLTLLTILPWLLYFIYAYFGLGLLQQQFSLRFFSDMWWQPSFYFQWKSMLDSTVGFHWALLGLAGSLMIRDRTLRCLTLGGWAGYLIYGFTFAYHMTTHDYYQMPAIFLTAIGLANLAHVILVASSLKARQVAALAAIFTLAAVLTTWGTYVDLKRTDYRPEEAIWRNLGAQLGHEARVVGLTHDYGFRLYQWGWVPSKNWLTSGDYNYRVQAGHQPDAREAFAELTQENDFFVVTLFGDFDSQPELKSMLVEHYPIFTSGDGFIVYDLRAEP